MKRRVSIFSVILSFVLSAVGIRAYPAASAGFTPSFVQVAPEGETCRFEVGVVFKPIPLPRAGGLIMHRMPTYHFGSYQDLSGAVASVTASSGGAGLYVDVVFSANTGAEKRSGRFILFYTETMPDGEGTFGYTRFARDTISFEQPRLQLSLPAPTPVPDYAISDMLSATVANTGMEAVVKRSYTAPHSGAGLADGAYAATVSYYDKLGFEVQQIRVGAACDGLDLITPHTYDFLWHDDVRIFLPYAARTGGAFNPEAEAVQAAYYQARYGRSPAYAVRKYEMSARDKVVGETAPGFTESRGSVISDDVATGFPCVVFRNGTVIADGCYPAGSVVTRTTKDADGRQLRRTTDRTGRLLCETSFGKREYKSGDVILIEDVTASTYYVYDSLDYMRCVVSPQASQRLTTLTDEDVDQYCYLYDYDARGRIAVRKLPGRSREYFAYNDADQVVSHRWDDVSVITHYDKLQRPVRDSLYCEEGGYLLSEYVYDAYDDDAGGLLALAELPEADLRLNGFKTSERLAVLGPEATSRVLRAYAYDRRGRPIRSVERYPDGSTLRIDTAYDFAGNILSRVQRYTHKAVADCFSCSYTYDSWGRLQQEVARLNDGPAATVTYTYDDQGRVVSQSFGNRLVRKLSDYNIQGWLTGLQFFRGADSLLGMRLRYYDPQLGSMPCYTGNISEWEWQHAGFARNAYGFSYDQLGRLERSEHYTDGVAADSFVESPIWYDLNGNPILLTRKAEGAVSRQFAYTYAGNRLATLRDGAAVYDYAYDTCGNMTHDGLHGLDLSYNHLNLIEKVLRGDTILAKYRYLSDGTKLSATDADGNGLCYSGSLVYNKQGDNLSLESAGFGGGRFVVTTNGIEPRYFVTDHLGSVRAVVNASGEVTERNDYYPFGKRWDDGQLSDNRYRYNGKEFQSFLNNPYIDYGARQYDPDAGIWHSPDPLAEKNRPGSPYVFCGNNPLVFVDPDGRDSVYVFDSPVRPLDRNIRGETYTAEIFVEVNGNIAGPYKGSSYPNSKSPNDNSTSYKTLTEGEHKFNNKSGHKGGTKKGLNIVNEEGKRESTAIDPNGENVIIRDANVHSGYSDNGGYMSRGSKGCITIHPDDAKVFFENFKWNEKNPNTGTSVGSIFIYRANTREKEMQYLRIK